MQQEIKIFLASSDELKPDRDSFGDLVRRLDEDFEKMYGLRIRLLRWEDFKSSYNGKRKQDEYNQKIVESDLFVALFHTKAGNYTIEEFNVAHELQKVKGVPDIYILIHDLAFDETETVELQAFKSLLDDELGHFWDTYSNSDMLKLIFGNKLYSQYKSFLPELKPIDSVVYLGETPIANIDELPLAANNVEFKKLKADLKVIETKIAGLKMALSLAHNEALVNILDEERIKQDALNSKIAKYEHSILTTAISIISIKGQRSSERYKQALEAFKSGDITEVNRLLDINTITQDGDQILAEITAGQDAIRSIINELQLKATSTMLTENDENRLNEACLVYEQRIYYAKKGALPKEECSNIIYDYAFFLWEHKQYEAGIKFQEEALNLREQCDIVTNSQKESHAFILNNLGNMHYSISNYNESESYYYRAFDIRSKLAEDNPIYLPLVARCMNNIGNLYFKKNDFNRAAQSYLQSTNLEEQLIENGNNMLLFDLFGTYNNFANLYSYIGEYHQAEAYFKKAINIKQKVSKLDLKNTSYLPEVAITQNNLASLYSKMGNYDKAKELYNEAIEIQRTLTSKNPYTYLADLTNSLNNLGVLYIDMELYADAEPLFVEALDNYRRLIKKNESAYLADFAKCKHNLGSVYFNLDKYNIAETLYTEALGIRSLLVEKESVTHLAELAASQYSLGELYHQMGRDEEAEETYRRSIDNRSKLIQYNAPIYLADLAICQKKLASLYTRKGQYKQALKAYEDALSSYKSLVVDNTNYLPDVIALTYNIATYILTNQLDLDLAKKYYMEIIEIFPTLPNNVNYEQVLVKAEENIAKINLISR